MPVVDYFLNSAVKYLQKKQKQRKKNKKKKRKAPKRVRKRKKLKTVRSLFGLGKRKKASAKKKPKKRPIKKASRKSPFGRKKGVKKTIKKAPSRKASKRSKKKRQKIKKVKSADSKSRREKQLSREIIVGVVTHYFSRIQVIVLKMTSGKLQVGDKIHIKGRTTDFNQQVKSLQIESVDVKAVRKGQLVGLQVSKKAKEGDKVFKIG